MKKKELSKKTKTVPRKSNAKTRSGTAAARPISSGTAWAPPTPEWLVQTAIQLLPKYENNEEARELQWLVAIEDAKKGLHVARRSLQAGAQWQDYEVLMKKRVQTLADDELTELEIQNGRVDFERGCKIITGEIKRLRAIQKWRAAAPTFYRLFKNNFPELIPNHEKEGFSVEDLASLKASFSELKIGQKKITLSAKLFLTHIW